MASTNQQSRVVSGSRMQVTTTTAPTPPAANYVQHGPTITTVRETERTTKSNKRGGDPIVKSKTKTVYYVDGKAIKLNWFDRLRIRFMSTHEKQAFLAEKLLKQERRNATSSKKSSKKTSAKMRT